MREDGVEGEEGGVGQHRRHCQVGGEVVLQLRLGVGARGVTGGGHCRVPELVIPVLKWRRWQWVRMDGRS